MRRKREAAPQKYYPTKSPTPTPEFFRSRSTRSVALTQPLFLVASRAPFQKSKNRMPTRHAPRTTFMTERKPPKRWTAAENADLIDRHDRLRQPFDEIALEIGRSPWGCKQQYHALKRGTAAPSVEAGKSGETKKTHREAMTERAQQALHKPLRYASPFGELLGEPPIGRSALDKKQQANA
jgi:hypothetical protein